MGRPS